jgi:hypothetical protein
MDGYKRFVAAGFDRGRREELRGGGLVRSSSRLTQLLEGSPEERELSDERILGSDDFVESVLRDSDASERTGSVFVDEILKRLRNKRASAPSRFSGRAVVGK